MTIFNFARILFGEFFAAHQLVWFLLVGTCATGAGFILSIRQLRSYILNKSYFAWERGNSDGHPAYTRMWNPKTWKTSSVKPSFGFLSLIPYSFQFGADEFDSRVQQGARHEVSDSDWPTLQHEHGQALLRRQAWHGSMRPFLLKTSYILTPLAVICLIWLGFGKNAYANWQNSHQEQEITVIAQPADTETRDDGTIVFADVDELLGDYEVVEYEDTLFYGQHEITFKLEDCGLAAVSRSEVGITASFCTSSQYLVIGWEIEAPVWFAYVENPASERIDEYGILVDLDQPAEPGQLEQTLLALVSQLPEPPAITLPDWLTVASTTKPTYITNVEGLPGYLIVFATDKGLEFHRTDEEFTRLGDPVYIYDYKATILAGDYTKGVGYNSSRQEWLKTIDYPRGNVRILATNSGNPALLVLSGQQAVTYNYRPWHLIFIVLIFLGIAVNVYRIRRL